DAEVEPLSNQRVRKLHSKLRVMPSFDVREIGFDAKVVQPARLAEGDRLIRKRVCAGKVLHVVQTKIWIDGQNRGGAEDVDVTGCDVQAVDELALILTERLLIKLIRRLKVVARQKQVKVEGVF